ncbi:prenyltransferase, partial [candidate division WOR-3 bacterium]|nr:prenyltransferase [candidate division WOR-3 bacterium]
AGYYLQIGRILPVIHWLSLPIGLTIFNVILLNEMPDYEADRVAGKKNMMVRLGTRRGSYLYAIVSALAWFFFYVSIRHGVPQRALWFYLPVFALSVVLVFLVVQRRWQNRRTLETLCGATILVNLGTSASYIFAYL